MRYYYSWFSPILKAFTLFYSLLRCCTLISFVFHLPHNFHCSAFIILSRLYFDIHTLISHFTHTFVTIHMTYFLSVSSGRFMGKELFPRPPDACGNRPNEPLRLATRGEENTTRLREVYSKQRKLLRRPLEDVFPPRKKAN